ncbi:MAG: outer membrane protein transport protein [Bacteroidota bacterium]
MKFILLFFFPLGLFAGGFDVNLQGIRQQGMGHTGTGLLQGASNLFFNPGSATFLKGKFQFQGGVNVSAFNAVYYDPISGITARTKDRYLVPFTLYANVRLYKGLTLGMAVYDPYGTDIYWDDNWKGRFLVQDVSVKTTHYQPTLSLALGKKVGIGLGFIYSTGSAGFSRDIPVTSAEGARSYINCSGSTSATGVNAGIFYKPTEKWNFGISYRSGMKYKLDNGDVDIIVPETFRSLFPSNLKFATTVPVPDVVNFGVSARFSKRFVMAADVNYQTWSVYRRLNIDFNNENGVISDISQIHECRNTTSVRIGAQYTQSCCLTFRAGVAYEQSPVNRNFYFPDSPDSDRFTFHGGFTYDFDDHWSIDLAAQLIEGRQIEGNYSPIDFRGLYKTRTIVGSGGITYTF